MAHNHKGCSGCEELSDKLEKEKEEKHSNCKKAVIAHEEKIGKLEKKLFAMTIAGAVAVAVVGKELADKIIDALDNVEKVQERLEEKISLPADVTSSLPPNDFSFDYKESVRRLVQIQNEKKENNLAEQIIEFAEQNNWKKTSTIASWHHDGHIIELSSNKMTITTRDCATDPHDPESTTLEIELKDQSSIEVIKSLLQHKFRIYNYSK